MELFLEYLSEHFFLRYVVNGPFLDRRGEVHNSSCHWQQVLFITHFCQTAGRKASRRKPIRQPEEAICATVMSRTAKHSATSAASGVSGLRAGLLQLPHTHRDPAPSLAKPLQ